MSDSDCIFSLIPKDGSVFALDAFYLPQNDQYLAHDTTSKSSWREETPATCDGNDYDDHYRNIEARFPFDKGFPVEFGSDPNFSHFLLQNTQNRDEVKRRGKWASRRHFRITFDYEARLVLYSYPKAPTMRVSYNGQLADAESKRHGVTWILFPGMNIEIIINDECVFKILVPPHDPNRIGSHLQQIHEAGALPSILNLNIESQPITAADSEVPTRGQPPLYFTEQKVGEGRHGRVYIALNVHTGFRYAKKVACPNTHFRKDIAILRSLSHERIIQIFDFDEAGRFFFMEYLSWGSLKDEHRRLPFANEEVPLICGQGLEGLGYLHNSGIALRDIKPEDVLLSSPRENLSIKFVDFSTAALLSDSEHYKTFCGNPRFSAPEIFVLGKYQADKADLWSWGLNILALLHCLPRRPDSDETSIFRDQANWFKTLFGWMRRLEISGLVDFLLTNLLQQEPERRNGAGKCLHLLRKSGLYVPAAVTPTEVSSPRSPMSYHQDACDPKYPFEFRLASNDFNRLSPNHSLPSTSYSSRRSLGPGLSQQDPFRSVIEPARPVHASGHRNQNSYKRKGSTLSSGSVKSSGKRSTGYSHSTSQKAQDSHHQQELSRTANMFNSQASTRRSHGSSQSHLEAIPVTALLRNSIFDDDPEDGDLEVSEDEDARTERATSGHPSLGRSHLDGVLDPDVSQPLSAHRPLLSPDPSVFSLLAGSSAWGSLEPGHASQSKRSQTGTSLSGVSSRSKPGSPLGGNSFAEILEQAAEDTARNGEELWMFDHGQYHCFRGLNKVYSQPEHPQNVWVYSEHGWNDGDKNWCYWGSDETVRYSSGWGDEDVESKADEDENVLPCRLNRTPLVRWEEAELEQPAAIEEDCQITSLLKTEEESSGYLTIWAPEAPEPKYFLICTANSKLCMTILLQMAGMQTSYARRRYIQNHPITLSYAPLPSTRGGRQRQGLHKASWVDIHTGLQHCNSLLPDEAPALLLTLQRLGYLPSLDPVGACQEAGGSEDTSLAQRALITYDKHSPQRCNRINPTTGMPCDTVFSRPFDLKYHEDTIHDTNTLVRCPYCEITYKRLDRLPKHILKMHPKVPIPAPNVVRCQYCPDEKMFNRNYLLKHIRKVHPQADIPDSQAHPFKCERCLAVFTQPQSLSRHEDEVHNAHKQFRCVLCPEEKTFTRKAALTRHIRRLHPDVG